MSSPIPYNPNVLRWARESLHLDVNEVALRMGKKPSDIEAWENGNTSPTYIQLEKLAYQIYKRPIALFFFPEPPEEEAIELNEQARWNSPDIDLKHWRSALEGLGIFIFKDSFNAPGKKSNKF